MKVLVIASSNDSYGVAESLMTLVLALAEETEIEPVVLTKKRNKINMRCDEAGIENHSYWYADIMAGAAYSGCFMRTIKHIVKYLLYLLGCITKYGVFFCGINFKEIDIVHTCHNRIDIGAFIAKRLKVPHVWHIREFGEEDYDVHIYKRNCIKYMNDNADSFIAISSAVAEKWLERGISGEKMQIVYNGVDSRVFYPDHHEKTDIVRVVISSRVQPSKGQLQLVQAVADMPGEYRSKFEVDIIGSAYHDYELSLKKVISENKLENVVRLKGHCNNISEIVRKYDIGVVCSRAEAFGRVTAEYMMSGLAVIASDTGANRELIIDGESGILYRYDDAKDLCNKLMQLKDNRMLIKELAENGRNRAEQLFTQKRYCDGILDVYRKTLD